MGRRLRTFVALNIPEEVREEVEPVQKRLSASGTPLRAVSPANMHVTLKFIGDWEENRLMEVCEAVARGASSVEPFELRFRGIGAFPHLRKPRVVTLACESDPPDALQRLHAALERELEALGIPNDGRVFRPHITLARVKGAPGPDLRDAILQFGTFEAGSGRLDEVVVYLSEPAPGGPVYTRVGAAPVGGA